jgi:hypothetical protein
MKEAYVKTKNTEDISVLIRRQINANGIVRVIGDVGLGKTTLKNNLIRAWQGFPDRFVVIPIQSFKLNDSRIRAVMKLMIRAIAPNERVPGSPELTYDTLRNVLANAYAAKLKPILIFDECQDLSETTLRELKKVHEISALGVDHLFAIVMFGKPSLRQEEIYRMPELGKRTRTIQLKKPSADELMQMAEEYGLRFPAGKDGETIRRQFHGVTGGTPLGVKNVTQILYSDVKNFDGNLNLQIWQGITKMNYADQLKKRGYTLGDVGTVFKKMFGRTVSNTVLSKVSNGVHDTKIGDDTVADVELAIQSLISNAHEKSETRKSRIG